MTRNNPGKSGFFSAKEMDVLQLARHLISYDTVSHKNNVEVIDFLDTYLQESGLATERVRYTDPDGVEKTNLVARKASPFTQSEGGLAFLAHVDTVPASDWPHNPFAAWIEDGKLYGRGSCDMKGSIAAVLIAIAQYRDVELERPLYCVITADEEIGGRGAQEVLQHSQMLQECMPKYGLVVEPTNLGIIHAHKGLVLFDIRAEGTSAHSSTGEGVNANLKMIPFLTQMQKIHHALTTQEQYFDHDFTPPFSDWNITFGDNNCAPNMTASTSYCQVLYRSMPKQNWQEWIAKVEALAEEYSLTCNYIQKAPSLFTPPESPIVQAALEITGNKESTTASYGTDGFFFGEKMEVVLFGPGDIKQAHSVNEWIDIGQLQESVSLFARFVERFCLSS